MSEIKQFITFDNTEKAFAHKSKSELAFTRFIFKMMQNETLVDLSTSLTLLALKLHLPIQWIIKRTIFKQFCGGATIQDCTENYEMLRANHIEAILDYSVEGQEDEKTFDFVRDELLRLIDNAKKHARIPTTCLKVTGLARFAILEKVNADKELNHQEKAEYNRVISRLDAICKKAFDNDVKIYIDAEETWIQDAIDRLAEVMMQKYNQEKAIVFTTLQMYRHDRLAYLNSLIEKSKNQGFILGIKQVRGAYMEKERDRAKEKKYPSPIQPDKTSTDRDYNKGLEIMLANMDRVEICAGTHNEKSASYLAELMAKHGLENNDPRIFFSQLFGMSDNISFILADLGYNVSKYLPYGPVKDTMPYLIRRAQENTSVAGQMGKELSLVIKELERRN